MLQDPARERKGSGEGSVKLGDPVSENKVAILNDGSAGQNTHATA